MEELIDVLNEKGEKTGKVVTRKEVHEKGLWHKVIVVAILDGNGCLLMQQRSESVETSRGKWDVSAAGHVSSGQTSKQAALREVSEEIGLNLEEDELKYILTYTKNAKKSPNYIDNQFLDCYIVKKSEEIDIKKIKVQESEVKQVKICTRKEVEEKIQNNEVIKRDELYKELMKYLKD